MVRESKEASGITSPVGGGLRVACRGNRSVGVGAFLMLAAMSAPVACSDDSNDGGAGGGGSGGAGGSGGGGVDGGGNPDTSTACAVVTGLDTYVANLTKSGKNQVLSFQIVQSDPAPPAEGSNSWKVKVLGGDGMPIADDKLDVNIWMTGHEHGTPIPPNVFYDGETKTFAINPVHLSMGGTWRITFSIFDPSNASILIDSAQFFFCVD